MLVENRFSVPVPIDQAWDALLDVERIAPCLPGATLDGRAGDAFTGRVKVKVGPIQLAYRGEAVIAEQDVTAYRAVIMASGKETRGSGGASARVVATLSEGQGETHVDVHTELDLSGKPAQFGRSIITEVSGRLLDQFAGNLASLLSAPDEPEPVAAEEPAAVVAAPAVAAPAGAHAADAGTLDVWSLLPRSTRLAVLGAVPGLLLVLVLAVRRLRRA